MYFQARTGHPTSKWEPQSWGEYIHHAAKPNLRPGPHTTEGHRYQQKVLFLEDAVFREHTKGHFGPQVVKDAEAAFNHRKIDFINPRGYQKHPPIPDTDHHLKEEVFKSFESTKLTPGEKAHWDKALGTDTVAHHFRAVLIPIEPTHIPYLQVGKERQKWS